MRVTPRLHVPVGQAGLKMAKKIIGNQTEPNWALA